MGKIQFGVPETIVSLLKEQGDIQTFIECGTYHGTTAQWASKHFKNVHTIEAAETLYRNAADKFSEVVNLKCHFGDSRIHLPKILKIIDERTIIWMDAHWSGGETYGNDDECPLIDELRLISETNCPSPILLIDDARLFTATPPLPHKVENWPSIADIIAALPEEYHIRIHDDVVFAIPIEFAQILDAHIQKILTARKDEEKLLPKTRGGMGILKIKEGLIDLKKDAFYRIGQLLNLP